MHTRNWHQRRANYLKFYEDQALHRFLGAVEGLARIVNRDLEEPEARIPAHVLAANSDPDTRLTQTEVSTLGQLAAGQRQVTSRSSCNDLSQRQRL